MEATERLTGEKMHTVRALNESISMNIDRVIRRAMSIKPADRYQSIAEMQDGFQKPSKVVLSKHLIETKVKGVVYEGRQEVVAELQVGEEIKLVRDPHNPYDRNAIKVMCKDGQQIGFLPRELAADLASRFDNYGQPVKGNVAAVLGGYYSDSRVGVTIKFRPPEEIELQFSQDNLKLSDLPNSGSTVNSMATIYNPPSVVLHLIGTLEGHTSAVFALAISPDGTKVVSGSLDNTLKVWDLPSGRLLRTLRGHTDCVNTVIITPDGTKIISGSNDKTSKVWDFANGRLLRTLEGGRAVGVSADSAQLISGKDAHTINIWNLASGRLTRTLQEDKSQKVYPRAIMPDGTKIISTSDSHAIMIVDLRSSRLLLSLEGHTDVVRALAITHDCAKVVSASYDHTLKVWDLHSGQMLHSLEGHTNYVTAVAVSPDSTKVVSGSIDSTLKVWDLESGQLLCSLKGHSSSVQAVAFTPDGKRVISGSGDHTLKVWDLEIGDSTRIHEIQIQNDSALNYCIRLPGSQQAKIPQKSYTLK